MVVISCTYVIFIQQFDTFGTSFSFFKKINKVILFWIVWETLSNPYRICTHARARTHTHTHIYIYIYREREREREEEEEDYTKSALRSCSRAGLWENIGWLWMHRKLQVTGWVMHHYVIRWNEKRKKLFRKPKSRVSLQIWRHQNWFITKTNQNRRQRNVIHVKYHNALL